MALLSRYSSLKPLLHLFSPKIMPNTHTSSLNPAANVWRSSVQFLACYQRVTSNYVFDISPIHCRSLHFTINYIDNFYTVEITNKTSWNKSFRFDTFFHRQNDNWDVDVGVGDKEDAVNGLLFSQLCVKLIGSWVYWKQICYVLNTLYRKLVLPWGLTNQNSNVWMERKSHK